MGGSWSYSNDMGRKDVNKKDVREFAFLRRELIALAYLGVGTFVYLSLLSYNPFDPSFNSLANHTDIDNWGGFIGSYLSDGLFFLFGAGAYFIGAFFVLVGVFFLIGWRDRIARYDIPIYLICVLFISILFQLIKGRIEFFGFEIQAGGLFGSLFADWGRGLVGRPGTYLLVTIGALLTFVWATKLSVSRMGVTLGRLMQQLGLRVLQLLTIFWHRSLKLLGRALMGLKQKGRGWFEKKRKASEDFRDEPSAVVKVRKTDIPFSATEMKTEAIAFLKEVPIASLKKEGATAEGPRIFNRVDTKEKKNVKEDQLEFQSLQADYQFPPLGLLDSDGHKPVVIDEGQLKMNARLLEKKLLDFSVQGRVTEIHPGPVVTMYEFQPAAGVKLSRIANLMDDLSLVMGGRSVRIVAPLPNKPAVGIEIPNNEREMVLLKDIIADEAFQKKHTKIPFALGKDIEGNPTVADLGKMPHLLIAGATGAGKSVSINAMILSLLYKSGPEDVRIIMVDPKMLELSIYEGIPHLLLPVVTQPKKATLALQWAVREMERRYKLLADINARSIANYNEKILKGNIESKLAKIQEMRGGIDPEDDPDIRHEGKLPYIVIIIDELADLMMVSSREIEESITRLAQMARAAGIHLILATQRPSVDVLTGVIKANFPARISFKVSSKHDSRTILDAIGSERLLGNGDMLFIPPGITKMVRVHGAFVTEVEVGRVVAFLKKQGKPIYDEEILKPQEGEGLDGIADEEEADELYDHAIQIVAETRQVSISLIQRKLRVGYNRAARMVERMEADGIVSPPSGAGHRQVLVSTMAANS